MAPNYRHGKTSRLVVSSIDASSLFNDMTLGHTVDTAETTVYGSNDRTYIAGLRAGTISASGLLDASTAGANDPYRVFRSALGAASPLVVTAIPGAPGGSTVTPGTLCHMATVNPTGFETAAPAMGVVTAKFDGEATDRFDIGRVVYGPAAAITTTGAKTGVDFSTKTAAAGVAHFHITNASTVGSVTLKVQHSSALAGTYSDLATFTSTDVGSQRSTIANSTLKRYVRLNVSSFTGGATKSVKVVVGFARRGTVI